MNDPIRRLFTCSEWTPFDTAGSLEVSARQAYAVIACAVSALRPPPGPASSPRLVELRLETVTHHLSARLTYAAARDLAERLLDCTSGGLPDIATRVTARPFPSAAPPPSLGYLAILSGPDPQLVGRTYPLRGETIHVGRDAWNAVALNDPDVSRYHAILVANSVGHRLHDLESTNGTMVNGQKMKAESILRTGDVILMGSTALRYERT